jgi:hypothetical protein
MLSRNQAWIIVTSHSPTKPSSRRISSFIARV